MPSHPERVRDNYDPDWWKSHGRKLKWYEKKWVQELAAFLLFSGTIFIVLWSIFR